MHIKFIFNRESEQINDTLNRNYACDVDENEIDEELQELDNELFKDMMLQSNKQKIPQPMVNVNNLQQQ